jgi:hypothetical protein
MGKQDENIQNMWTDQNEFGESKSMCPGRFWQNTNKRKPIESAKNKGPSKRKASV